MNSPPIILILEDERLQMLTLRSQLSDLGTLKEFSDPERALQFARENLCDVAIVDIRMPRRSMDGLGFLKELRTFDWDLSVVVRTADESDRVADGAIESRAIKRAIKSKTTVAELRRVIQEAILETSQRRTIVEAAKEAESLKRRLNEVALDLESKRAAAAIQEGWLHGLRKRLSGISILASLIRVGASDAKRPILIDQADKAAGAVKGLVDSIDSYLAGPFGFGASAEVASANRCLELLGQLCSRVENPANKTHPISIKPLKSDENVECQPLRLLSNLWQLADCFCNGGSIGTSVSISAEVPLTIELLQSHFKSATRTWAKQGNFDTCDYVVFRVAGHINEAGIETLADSVKFEEEIDTYISADLKRGPIRLSGGALLLFAQPPVVAVEYVLGIRRSSTKM